MAEELLAVCRMCLGGALCGTLLTDLRLTREFWFELISFTASLKSVKTDIISGEASVASISVLILSHSEPTLATLVFSDSRIALFSSGLARPPAAAA